MSNSTRLLLTVFGGLAGLIIISGLIIVCFVTTSSRAHLAKRRPLSFGVPAGYVRFDVPQRDLGKFGYLGSEISSSGPIGALRSFITRFTSQTLLASEKKPFTIVITQAEMPAWLRGAQELSTTQTLLKSCGGSGHLTTEFLPHGSSRVKSVRIICPKSSGRSSASIAIFPIGDDTVFVVGLSDSSVFDSAALRHVVATAR